MDNIISTYDGNSCDIVGAESTQTIILSERRRTSLRGKYNKDVLFMAIRKSTKQELHYYSALYY